MNAKFRRIIVWVLLISLILSLVPAVVLTAFAEDCAEGTHQLIWVEDSEDSTKCYQKCDNTGCTYVTESQEHDYTGVQPAAAENGTEHYWACKNCGFQDKKAHSYGTTGTPVDGGQKHTLTCSVCSHTKEEDHSYTATPTPVDGEKHSVKCDKCEYVKEENHSYPTGKPVKKDESKHYQPCEVCSYQKTEDHTYDQTVIEDGFKTGTEAEYYYSCVCGDVDTETFQVCTVTFASNGVSATMPENLTVVKDTKIAAPSPAPTSENKRFTGWKSGETDWDFDENTVSEDITLTAQWVKTFTVTFENGGVSATMPETQTVDEASKVTKPADPSTTENKRFKEWKSGETVWDFEQASVTADVTLTAQWVELYNVTIDSGITNGTVTAAPAKAAAGDTVTITAAPSHTYYELDTLTCTADGSTVTITNNSFTMPEKAVVVSAVFQPVPFTLSASPAGDLFVGSTTQLSTSTGITPAVWESSDATVAFVSTTGLVTGRKAGTAVITAKVDDEHKAEITVTVVALELTLADKTVSGKTGAALPTGSGAERLTLTLTEGSFVEEPAKTDILIAPLPAGVDYDVERLTDRTISLKLKGTPTAASASAITVTVKKEALANPPATLANQTVTNADTKWGIVQSVPITLDNGGHSAADGFKGKVTINPEQVIPGERVQITVEPYAPYKLKSVSYTVGTKTETLGNINGKYTFVMPEDAAAATIKVTYEITHTSKTGTTSGKIKSFAIPDHEALLEAILIGSSSVSTETSVTAEQLIALADDGDYVFVLEAESGKNNTADIKKLDTATNVTAVKQAVYSGDYKYMDLTLWLCIYDADGGLVGDPIQITDTGTNYVSLAFDALRSPATRLYYVHNGGAAAYYSQESGSTSGNVKYSKLHLFSTYELVYTTTSDNPKTADPFHAPIWLAVFLLSGLSLPAVIFGGRKYLK